MYRRPSRRSSGGGRGQPPQQPQNPYFPLQNPINTTYVYPSNPPFIPHNAYQNPYQIFSPSSFPTQTPNFSGQNPGFTPPSQQVSSSAVFQPQNSRDMLESIDRAVGKARHELAAAGENVSAWKVAQSTLLMLKVDSWDQWRIHSGVNGVARPLGRHGNKLRDPGEIPWTPWKDPSAVHTRCSTKGLKENKEIRARKEYLQVRLGKCLRLRRR